MKSDYLLNTVVYQDCKLILSFSLYKKRFKQLLMVISLLHRRIACSWTSLTSEGLHTENALAILSSISDTIKSIYGWLKQTGVVSFSVRANYVEVALKKSSIRQKAT